MASGGHTRDRRWRGGAAGSAAYRGLAATIVLAAGLAGCAHDDFKPELKHDIPHRFDASTSTKPTKISRWWKQFHSAELNHFMETANTENLDIAAAVAQFEAADAQAHIAEAPLWPALNFVDNNSRTRSSGTTGKNGVINSASQNNSLSRAISASYVLDVWGQNRDALEAAIHSANASAYQTEVVRLTVRAAVVNDYLIYAANQERLTVARENLRNAERILEVLLERRLAGTVSDLEVTQQGALVEIQRASIPLLRLAAAQSRTALALVLGRPVNGLELKVRSIRKLRVPTPTPGLPSTLLTRRPDIQAAEEQLAAADANVDVARKAFLPTINLTGQIGYQSAMLKNLFRPESLIFSLASGLTQPIFEGGRLRGQLALNEAQRLQLLETYRKSILSAFTDVENALIALKENAEREKALLVAVDLSRKSFQFAQERLAQGTIDLTTLLTTQNTLFQTEDTLIQVRLARLQAVVSLYQALGGDWDEAALVASTQ